MILARYSSRSVYQLCFSEPRLPADERGRLLLFLDRPKQTCCAVCEAECCVYAQGGGGDG